MLRFAQVFRRPADPNPRRHAFTLAEMLVVIGIIALLATIMVPVIGRVRKQAQGAQTRQSIARLTSAIERYFSDFRSYPGPIANSEIGREQIAGAGLITQSENLTLALLGGMGYGNGNRPSFNPEEVGRGAINLNRANPKRYQPYLDVQPDELSTKHRNPMGSFAPGQWGPADTIVPEFMDRFAEPQPIIYLRAKAGAPNAEQYNLAHLSPYAPPFPANYFRNPSLPEQPRQKDGYILISAGPDGKYGTNDDICNFGSP